jgi:hypothetical protein
MKTAAIAAISLFSMCSSACADEGLSVTTRADQAIATSCSKKEVRRYLDDLAKLTDSEKDWMKQWANKHYVADLTLDGVPDELDIVSTQYLRECDLKENIPYKDNLVYLKDGATGKRKQWGWKGGVPEKFTNTLARREIVITGRNMDDTPFAKTLTY